METQPKLNNSKEVIAFLAKKFPLCFIAEGEAKPLKIGIFQDLAERLADDESVSKTQLRAALRLYTTSWRYLYGVKAGANRVDLDGNDCGALEQEHIEFAANQLEEAKQKIRAKRKENEKAMKADAQPAKNAKAKFNKNKPQFKKNSPADAKQRNEKRTEPRSEKTAVVRQFTAEEFAKLTVDQKVKVQLGKSPVAATIVELNKDDVRVQLDSGLTIAVKPEHLVI